MRTLTGQKRHYKWSRRRLSWVRVKSTNGAGTKSERSMVLRRLNVCVKSSIKWIRPTQPDANNCSWVVCKLKHQRVMACMIVRTRSSPAAAMKRIAMWVNKKQQDQLIGSKPRISLSATWMIARSRSNCCLRILRLCRNLIFAREISRPKVRRIRQLWNPSQAPLKSPNSSNNVVNVRVKQ